MGKFEVLDHPLIQHKLTIIRNKDCGTREFREVVNEIAELMVYEVCRDMPLEDIEVETPVICRLKILRLKPQLQRPLKNGWLGVPG